MTTHADVWAKVVEIASARPDYVYEKDLGNTRYGCAYLNRDGTPSCLLGHALVDLGYQIDPLWNEKGYAEVAIALQIDGELTHCEALETAQVAQDAGYPWGEAIDSGLEF